MTPTLRLFLRLLFAVSLVAPSAILSAAETYPVHPDSVVQPAVPQGELIKYTFTNSKIFPGTTRDVTIYVPKQYDPAEPACVFIDQDGVQFKAPTVFDNLIARGELPVIIGVFVTPGIVKAANADAAQDRYNRSFEYDGLGDAYARFLLEELLPDVEKHTTADGRPIKLSQSGNDRAIAGTSSGAIAAFTAAWERPDAFSRVLSGIGTYVGLRGGHNYSTLIRKTEPKPIRVFLQDGENDNNLYAGDWWMANQAMERSLIFNGYEVNHVWGNDVHSGNHLTAIFPDAIRWLWKGWPEPVKAGALNDERMGKILIPGQGWELVGEGYRSTEGPAVNAKGEVFFNDVTAGKTYKIGLDGKITIEKEDSKRANGQAFDAQGRLYSVSMRDPKVLRYETDGKVTVLADDIAGNDLVVDRNGNVYVTNPPPDSSNDPSKLWLIKPDGTKQVVDTGGVKYMNGVTFSPDQSLLYVADYRSHWVYSYVVQPDATLAYKQRYYWLHVADTDDQSNADGIRTDTEGRLYVATRLGVQVCDQPGRVNAILPTPNKRVSNLVFGGEKFDTLYATCGDKIYKRKLTATGANAWGPPVKPARPRL
jgi:gluconolactonase